MINCGTFNDISVCVRMILKCQYLFMQFIPFGLNRKKFRVPYKKYFFLLFIDLFLFKNCYWMIELCHCLCICYNTHCQNSTVTETWLHIVSLRDKNVFFFFFLIWQCMNTFCPMVKILTYNFDIKKGDLILNEGCCVL